MGYLFPIQRSCDVKFAIVKFVKIYVFSSLNLSFFFMILLKRAESEISILINGQRAQQTRSSDGRDRKSAKISNSSCIAACDNQNNSRLLRNNSGGKVVSRRQGKLELDELESWVSKRRLMLISLPGMKEDMIEKIESSYDLPWSMSDSVLRMECYVCRGPGSDGLVNETAQRWMLVLCRSCARDCSSCTLAAPLPLRRRCRICTKWAIFGSPNSSAECAGRAVACADHRRPGEADVVHRLCQAGCGTVATSGRRDQGPLFCKRHRPSGLRTVTNRQCQHPEGCQTWPSFGPPQPIAIAAYRAASLARFCRRHRAADHVSLANRRCAAPGCRKQPRFGAAGPGLAARFCKAHWAEAGQAAAKSGAVNGSRSG